MEDIKLCPLKQNRAICQRTDCAFWISDPGKRECALATLAKASEEIAGYLYDIAANMPDNSPMI